MEERQKILIVDDQKENLVALRQVLGQVDADVIEAVSGNEALTASIHEQFAVAILDVKMPGMDGYELAELLRGDEKNKAIPIIFVTASYYDEVNMFRGYEAGGIDYIFKPFDPKVMVGKVRVFLELDRYREELRRHRDHLETLVEERTEDLEKRVKEIQCIYDISRLASEPNAPLEDVLAAAVDLIPPGWQYPDNTCARIIFEGHEFQTANFRETPWKLHGPIPFKGTLPGLCAIPSSVEVCYLEQRADRDEGPFLKEEIHLINEIADRLSVMIEGKRAEERERHLNAVLLSIRNINQLIVHEDQRDRLIQKACENLVSSRGFQGAWIILTGPFFADVEGAYAGFEHSQVKKLAAIFQSGALPRCCREGRDKKDVVVTENVSVECKECPLAGRYSQNSAMTLELLYQDKAYGWKGVLFPTKFSLDPEEASLLTEIAGDIAFALNGMDTATERKQAEADLRESEKRFRALFEGTAEGILVTDAESHFIRYANPAICRMLNYSREELLRMGVKNIHPEDVIPEVETALEQNAKGDFRPAYGLKCLQKDGKTIYVDIHPTKIVIDGQSCLLSCFSDVTEKVQLGKEKKTLERQLQQAQKMEALGQLAGGVAHDYNNMIGIILGYGDLVLNKMERDDPLRVNVQEIVSAAIRSKDITLQLLAFARQQRVNPRVLDLNEAVDGMLKMLRRVLGESIQLLWQPGHELWPVYLDPSQLVQILTNLCGNAYDAIKDVGKVTIAAENRCLKEICQDGAVEYIPGEYVILSVSDDGSGMDKVTMKKIFDPFFTTKEIGKGTGLGLSTVYGIVKQNHGFINVHSEIGTGTTFSVHLPRFMGSVAESTGDNAVSLPRSMGETVLVVEDEEQYLELIETLMTQLGYTVLVATTPGEALDRVRGYQGGIDLLITDVVMPEMNGKELGERLQSLHPGCKVIYISGYTPDTVAARGIDEEKDCFIRKPFVLSVLAQKARAIMTKTEERISA